ncbi:probable inactive leucine-rich repeat receptor kinase XIAO [Magnolia sinica]|uniref:probable inactive leucine-rich repeat receptor kinase XIAO n=1 Tax=Magnolia sinica TaxID=86752 RepID=UPI00265A9427|nr:probable inactive leucine-rich repeat receptor kinase XIAO [Magnolia sinica]
MCTVHYNSSFANLPPTFPFLSSSKKACMLPVIMSSSQLPFHLRLLLLLLISSLSPFVHPMTHPSDVSALISFKSSITPSSIPSWSCLATWNFSFDPCSSPRRNHFVCGLTCTPDSARVVALVLDPAGYSGTLSPLLSRLSQLNHLDLSDNSFHGQIPSSLSTLANLQTLTLRSNSFSGNLPPFSKLPSLQSIDISHNALSGTIPYSVTTLTGLRFLDLSFNSLVGSIPKLPPNLVELALKGNSLSGPLLEDSFKGLNELEVLELSSNRVSGTLKGWLFRLPSIQQIDLANNSLTRVEVWSTNGGDSDLVAVDLGFNKLEGYLPVNFGTFPRLSALSLRYNLFRWSIPGEYGKGSMRRLFLDGNFLNGRVPDGFLRGETTVSGSFADNCLEGCPSSVQLCLPSQKPASVCKQAYSRKPRSINSPPW